MPSTNGVGAGDRPHHRAAPLARPGREPSISDAFIRLFEAGQRVVLDRLDLARYDLALLAKQTLSAAALVAVGAVCLTGAWFAVLAAAVVWALNYMTLPAALALAGLASLAAGALLIAAGLRHARPDDDLAIPGMLRPMGGKRE
jgi:hypothetical protein